MEVGEDRRVLIVDDEALVRLYAVDVFEEAGYTVLEARDAEEALLVLAAQDSPVDLLFTDVNMPGSMDGVDLARAVHKLYPQMAILITSGKVAVDTSDLPNETPFLPKPYSPDAVLKVAGRCVGQAAH